MLTYTTRGCINTVTHNIPSMMKHIENAFTHLFGGVRVLLCSAFHSLTITNSPSLPRGTWMLGKQMRPDFSQQQKNGMFFSLRR